MNIYQTKVCLDCNNVFEGIRLSGDPNSQDCPHCGSHAWTWLSNILAQPQGVEPDIS